MSFSFLTEKKKGLEIQKYFKKDRGTEGICEEFKGLKKGFKKEKKIQRCYRGL